MALLDLTSPQASILAKVLNGTLAGPDGRTGPDWRTASPELAAVAHALDRLSFTTRACLVCGATFEAKNPRRTTCSDRCRQRLSRSSRHTGLVDQVAAASQEKRDTLRAPVAEHPQQQAISRLPQAPTEVPSIRGTLQGCVDQQVPIPPAPIGPRNRRIWHQVRVTVQLRPDGSYVITDVQDLNNSTIGSDHWLRNGERAVTEKVFHDGCPYFSAGMARAGGGATCPDRWHFCFGMSEGGVPWLGDLVVPDIVIEGARAQILKAQLASQPDRDGKDPAAALMACRRLLTPSVVSAIGALVDRLPDLDPHAWKYRWAPAANEYLSSGREGLPDDLRQEIEALAADGPGFRHVKLRAIAVGCMLRLPGLAQPIPTDPAAFAEWSGLALLGDHYRQANNPAAVTVTP